MPVSTAFGGGVVGKTTATAGTAWYALIPPSYNSSTGFRGYTSLLLANITNGNTATNVTLMRPIGRTVTTAASTTAANTVTLSADPGPTGNGVAANDIVVTQNADGTFTQYVVGAWNGTTKVMTLTAANLGTNIASGAKLWNYGINSDTDPVTGVAHPIIPNAVATNTTGAVFTTIGSGFRSSQQGEPLLVYCGNATNAVTANYIEYIYSNT